MIAKVIASHYLKKYKLLGFTRGICSYKTLAKVLGSKDLQYDRKQMVRGGRLREAKHVHVGPSTDDRDVHSSMDDHDVGPSTDDRDVGPSTDDRYVHSSMDDHDVGPSTDDRDVGPSTDDRDVGPSTDDQKDHVVTGDWVAVLYGLQWFPGYIFIWHYISICIFFKRE